MVCLNVPLYDILKNNCCNEAGNKLKISLHKRKQILSRNNKIAFEL